MYEAYFGLKENPFSIAPDPRYLYMSEKHQEALAHLMFSLSGGNRFVLLTGEVGTGKTTLCRGLLGQLPEDVDVALILNPRFNAVDLLAAVCDELGLKYPKDGLKSKTLNDLLVRHLLDVRRKGRRTFLIIDEAQNLGVEVLEEVRLLTNLETSEEKLLQIILIGQPELRGLLARDELRQLSQRITARYHLDTLTRSETVSYIEHRLAVAGCPRVLFSSGALAEVHKQSKGTPRLINTICDRSLLGAYAEGKGKVDRRTVRNAADEVLGESRTESEDEPPGLLRRLALPVLLVIVLVMAAGWYLSQGEVPSVDPIPGLVEHEPPPLPPSLEPETETDSAQSDVDDLVFPREPDEVIPEPPPLPAVVKVEIPQPEPEPQSLSTTESDSQPEPTPEAEPVGQAMDSPVIEINPVAESVETATEEVSEEMVKPAAKAASAKKPVSKPSGRPLLLQMDLHAQGETDKDLGFEPHSADADPIESGAN